MEYLPGIVFWSMMIFFVWVVWDIKRSKFEFKVDFDLMYPKPKWVQKLEQKTRESEKSS